MFSFPHSGPGGPALCPHERVELIYFNAGGGHRAAALALQSELRAQHPDWAVTAVDLFRLLDPRGRFRRLTGFAPEAYYNRRLSTGMTLGLAQELKMLQAMIRMWHARLVRLMEAHWRATTPTLVVSLVPNFNRAMADSLNRACPNTPFVTIMTDLADHPPHFWIEPGYTEHLICGTDRAAQQARAQGIKADRIHVVSGMILSPRFHQLTTVDRDTERRALGLDPGTPLGLVMFGGQGSARMKRIAQALDDRPLILLCGRNTGLLRTLAEMPARAPRQCVGFTSDVARWMRLADYFIGKPGPGSISEALHCGLPVIVTRNAWTMPQERWNADWVGTQGLGKVLPSFSGVAAAVDELLADLEPMRARIAAIENRALFEIPRILAKLLETGRR